MGPLYLAPGLATGAVALQATSTHRLGPFQKRRFSHEYPTAALNVVCSRSSALPQESRAPSSSSSSFPHTHPPQATLHIMHRIEDTVYPLSSHHPLLHQLSELDQLLPPNMAVPILLFFTAPQCSASAANVVTALKRSLSELLPVFYPMAGRLVEREGAGGRLDVSCLDQGVPFSEAWADCPLSFFGPDFQPHPAFHLLSPLPFSSAPDALLHVQVTHFTCEGFCLCVQEHHILSDGVSFFQFMESWVEILKGNRGLTVYPHMDLSILKDGYRFDNQLTLSSQYAQNFLESDLIDFSAQNKMKFISKIFSFTPDFIVSLKEEAKSSNHHTSYECIVAYLWQNVTRVHQYPPNENTRLAYPVDIRKRLKPRLPPGYFGNALLTGFAYAKVEDLVTRPISYAMSLVREATLIMTNDYMKLALDWLGKQKSPPYFSVASHRSLFANSWIRFPLCELDFPWGKPCCFRTHLPPDLAGEFVLILPSTLGKNHLDVQVNLQCEHMVKLEALIKP